MLIISTIEAFIQLAWYSMHSEKCNVTLNADPIVLYEFMDQLKSKKNTLIAFFDYCQSFLDAKKYTYQEFPQHFV